MKLKLIVALFLQATVLNVYGVYQFDEIQKADVDRLNQKSMEFTGNNIDSAIVYANKALKISEDIGYQTGQIFALCNLGFGFYIKYDIDKSIFHNEKALTLSEEVNDNLGKATSLNNLGLIDWRKGSYSDALLHYTNALKYAQQAGSNIQQSRSYNYIGLVYWKIGYYPKSIENLFKSLEIKEILGNQFEIALTLNNLSNVYNEMGKHSTGVVFAKRALEISEGSKNDYALGRALGNIGVSYFNMEKYNDALDNLKRALTVKRRSGEVKGLGYTHIDIGNIYSVLDSSDLAEDHFTAALKIMTGIDDMHGLAIAHGKLGENYLTQNKLRKAKKEIDKSLAFAEKANLRESIKNNYRRLSRLSEKLNDHKNSLKYFRVYSNLKDSLLNQSNNAKIADLQVRYETTEKEKENELLKQQNLIQAYEIEKQNQYILFMALGIFAGLVLLSAIVYRYYLINKTSKLLSEKNIEIETHRQRLEQLNVTKDKLFSIIAHDLKNPFQSIIGYTNLLTTDYNDFNDGEKKTIIKEIGNASEASYQLLENLLQWAQAQTGNLLYAATRVNLQNIIEETIKPVKSMAASKNIDLNITIGEHEVYIDEDFLKTILRNLVTNAIKFTEPHGHVKIATAKKESNIVIGVTDDGIGISEEKIDGLFSGATYHTQAGTSNERGTGLGLIICKELIQRYEGKIWAESKIGEGSTFYFTVPVAAVTGTFVN